ncbi:MAG: hypothetical protein NTY00_06885 [Deltaproteobacteria bacterium]|nr:hypothetical protein [Deltaproteobacteria bacterium]
MPTLFIANLSSQGRDSSPFPGSFSGESQEEAKVHNMMALFSAWILGGNKVYVLKGRTMHIAHTNAQKILQPW